MINEAQWEKLFGFPAVKPDGNIEQKHCNVAYAIQKVTEEIVIKMAKEAKRITGTDSLCMAEGCSKFVANGKLLKESIFENIFIQPAAGDAGGALGAAQAAYYMFFDQQRNKVSPNADAMKGTYLGLCFFR